MNPMLGIGADSYRDPIGAQGSADGWVVLSTGAGRDRALGAH